MHENPFGILSKTDERIYDDICKEFLQLSVDYPNYIYGFAKDTSGNVNILRYSKDKIGPNNTTYSEIVTIGKSSMSFTGIATGLYLYLERIRQDLENEQKT